MKRTKLIAWLLTIALSVGLLSVTAGAEEEWPLFEEQETAAEESAVQPDEISEKDPDVMPLFEDESEADAFETEDPDRETGAEDIFVFPDDEEEIIVPAAAGTMREGTYSLTFSASEQRYTYIPNESGDYYFHAVSAEEFSLGIMEEGNSLRWSMLGSDYNAGGFLLNMEEGLEYEFVFSGENLEGLTVSLTFIKNRISRDLSTDGVLRISGQGMLDHDSLCENYELAFDRNDVKTLIIDEGILAISDYTFNRYESLSRIEFPESLYFIGSAAFIECDSITEITFREGLKYIDGMAFQYCDNLKTVTLPDSLEHLGYQAFYYCYMDEITVPRSLKTIGGLALFNSEKVYYLGSASEWETATNGLRAVSEFTTVYDNNGDIIQQGKETETELFAFGPNWQMTRYDSGLILDFTAKTGGVGLPGGKGAGYEWVDHLDEITDVVIATGIQKITSFWSRECLKSVTIPWTVTSIKSSRMSDVEYIGKIWNESTQQYELSDGFVLKGYAGSEAEAYANKHGLPFEDLSGPAKQTVQLKTVSGSVAAGKATMLKVSGALGAVSFSSSDEAIATVSAEGEVTAQKAGNAKITVTVSGTEECQKAEETVNIKVLPAATSSLKAESTSSGMKLTWKKVAGATGYYIYRGSKQVKKLSGGSTVTYTDKGARTNGTKYTFKVVAYASTGKSTLSRSVTAYCLSTPKISSLKKKASGKALVKWGRNTKGNGYEIQYSTSRTFASGNKTAKVKNKSTVSKTLTGLKSGKTYYVRVRSYKTVSAKTYYSAWSAKKSVKV